MLPAASERIFTLWKLPFGSAGKWGGRALRGGKPSPACRAVHGAERVRPVGAGERQSPAPGVGTEGLRELGWPAWACPLGVHRGGQLPFRLFLAPLFPTHRVSSCLCRLWLEPAWLGRCQLPSRPATEALGGERRHRPEELPSLLTHTGPGWLCSDLPARQQRAPENLRDSTRGPSPEPVGPCLRADPHPSIRAPFRGPSCP